MQQQRDCGISTVHPSIASGPYPILPPLPLLRTHLRALPQCLQVVGRWAAIAISESHSSGLSCEGQLYTWGANQRGQLGLGDKSPGVVDTPVPVQTLSDLDVK